MAEVIAEHQLDFVRYLVTTEEYVCICGKRSDSHPAHQAAMLTAAGFGPVKAVQAEALRDAAEAGRDPSVKDMDAYHIDQADVWLWLQDRAASIEESQ